MQGLAMCDRRFSKPIALFSGGGRTMVRPYIVVVCLSLKKVDS